MQLARPFHLLFLRVNFSHSSPAPALGPTTSMANQVLCYKCPAQPSIPITERVGAEKGGVIITTLEATGDQDRVVHALLECVAE